MSCARPVGCSTTRPAPISRSRSSWRPVTRRCRRTSPCSGFADAGHRAADDRRDRLRHRADDLRVHPRVRHGGRRATSMPASSSAPTRPSAGSARSTGCARATSPTARRSTSPDDSTDVAFSYITLQHCDTDDALDLTSEAVRITRPGGKIALNYRGRSGSDVVLLPLGSLGAGIVPDPGNRYVARTASNAARLGWQANRLQPRPGHRTADRAADRHPGVAASEEQDVRLRRRDQDVRRHQPPHYWVVATVR